MYMFFIYAENALDSPALFLRPDVSTVVDVS